MNKRKKKDIWARALFVMNTAAWILLLILFLVFHRAQPEFESFFDRFYKLTLRTDWDMQYLYYLIYLVMISIFICLSGLLLSIFRGRRKTDHKFALVITGIISLSMLAVAMAVR